MEAAIDVTAWLRSLGLEQYAQSFRDNGIDMRVLRKLSAEDLKDLGITMVGHRRLLIDAIAALREATVSAASSEARDVPPMARSQAAPKLNAGN